MYSCRERTSVDKHHRTRFSFLFLVWRLIPIFLTLALGMKALAQTQSSNVSNDWIKPQLALQLGHAGLITQLTFNKNGKLIASIGGDSIIKVWDITTSKIISTINTTMVGTQAITFSPDGKLLAAAGGFGGLIGVWDVSTGQRRHSLTLKDSILSTISFSPNGKWLAAGGLISRDKDGDGEDDYEKGIVQLWRADTWREYPVIESLSKSITSLSFNAKEDLLAAKSAETGKIKVWRIPEFTDLATLDGPTRALSGDMSFSPDGSCLASTGSSFTPLDDNEAPDGSADGEKEEEGRLIIRVWSVPTWRESHTIERNNFNLSAGSFSSDGGSFAALENFPGRIRLCQGVWKISTLREFSIDMPYRQGSIQSVISPTIALSPDASLIALHGTSNSIILIDVGKGTERSFGRSVVAHSLAASSSDDKWLALGNAWSISLWHFGVGRRLQTMDSPLAIQALAFSPNNQYLASLHYDAKKRSQEGIVIREVATGKKVKTLPARPNPGPRKQFSFSPDGGMIAYINGGQIEVWNLATESKLKIPNPRIGGFSSVTNFFSFSPNGKWLAASKGDGIAIWEVSSWQRMPIPEKKLEFDKLSFLSFSPDSQLLAFGASTVRFFQVGSWQELETLRGLNGIVQYMSPDWKRLVLTGVHANFQSSYLFERSIRSNDFLWNTQEVSKLTGVVMPAWSQSTALSPNGEFYVIPGSNGTYVWDVKTGSELCALVELNQGDDWLIVNRNEGLFDGTADAMQQVNWQLNKDTNLIPLDSYFTDFYYPGLLMDSLAHKKPKAPVDFALFAQIPSLRTMFKKGLVHFEPKASQPVICFKTPPTVIGQLALSGTGPGPLLVSNDRGIKEDRNSAVCRYYKELPQGIRISQLEGSLKNTRNDSLTSPWDNLKSDTSGATLHVLTIAISKYMYPNSRFSDLPKAVEAAAEVSRFFQMQKGRSPGVFAEIKIWEPSLFDQYATLKGIRGRLEDMSKQVKQEDVVFIYMTGHGDVPVGQEMFYFAPHDFRSETSEDERNSGFNTAMMAEALRNLAAKRIVLIVDACQSGGAVESLEKIAEIKTRVEMQGANQEGVGIYVVAAATPLEIALGGTDEKKGVLVEALLEALENNRRGGAVWIKDVMSDIEERLTKKQSSFSQTPMIVKIGLDFPIATTNH